MGLRETLIHDPNLDPSKVGITFVELLFAAVVPFQLEALDHWWQLRAVGWVQVSTSAILLLTSWIGYHNSVSRLRWLIRFVNLPLLILVLDVLMVLVYGFSAFAAEVGARAGTGRYSPVPMAVAVAISFSLYVIWDCANLAIKKATKYQEAWRNAHDEAGIPLPKLADTPRRRHVTWVFFVVSLVVVALSILVNSGGSAATKVIVVDAVLVIVLIAFRLGKEWRGKQPAKETVFVEAGTR